MDMHHSTQHLCVVLAVRRSVTRTCRQPVNGSHSINWWQTPLRSYS